MHNAVFIFQVININIYAVAPFYQMTITPSNLYAPGDNTTELKAFQNLKKFILFTCHSTIHRKRSGDSQTGRKNMHDKFLCSKIAFISLNCC